REDEARRLRGERSGRPVQEGRAAAPERRVPVGQDRAGAVHQDHRVGARPHGGRLLFATVACALRIDALISARCPCNPARRPRVALRRLPRGFSSGRRARMTENKFELIDPASARKSELPVRTGTIGPAVLDISSIHRDLGVFTYDPGFALTASTESRITYIDGDAGVLLYRGYPIE